MQRGFTSSSPRESQERPRSVEPAVPLKSVVHNPGTSSLFPSFASLFDDGPAITPRHAHELSLQRAVTSQDVAPLLNSRMRERARASATINQTRTSRTNPRNGSAPWPRAKHSRTCRGASLRMTRALNSRTLHAFASNSSLDDAERTKQLDEAQATRCRGRRPRGAAPR